MRRAAIALSAPLLLLASASLLPGAAAPEDARLVTAEVLLGETVLLRGSTSDDGKPDVDQVWSYLRGLRLKPTEAFDALRTERAGQASEPAEPTADERYTLRRGEKDPWIHLRIAYGGRAEVFALTLLRDDGGWRVDTADLDRYADMRWIRRSEAARLHGVD